MRFPRTIVMITATACLFTVGVRAADVPVEVQRAPQGGLQPQAAIDAEGRVHLIYFMGEAMHGDVRYVRSTNGGATWSKPLTVNGRPGSVIAAGNIRGAHLAMGKGGRPHVAWMGSSKAEPKNGAGGSPMLYTRLNDAGDAFEPERNVMQASDGLDGGGSIAADDKGNVYVAWHAAPVGKPHDEMNRTVFVTRSIDDGVTFAPEVVAAKSGNGACGCCGMRAFADSTGRLHLLYRTAHKIVDRDMHLLTSPDGGESFTDTLVDAWRVGKCPMSLSSIAEGGGQVVMTWEHDGQVLFARRDAKTGRLSKPVAAPGSRADGRKHPVVAVNAAGHLLLAWTQGMGWNKGGDVQWQVYDADDKPLGEMGEAKGVPAWSLVTAWVKPDGAFVVMY